MADVVIPFGENDKENAILLLAAAKTLGRERYEVRTGVGKFVVDEEIAIEAGLVEKKEQPKAKAEAQQTSEAPAKKAPAKRTAKKTAKKAAKKSTAKKTAAKKSSTKKSSPKKSQE